MRSCVLTELLLVSFKGKRARRVPFHPKTTVLVGPNDTGKSSVLKSIYWAFGTEPSVTHPTWSDADVAALVRFRIGEKGYQIVRQRDQYVLADQGGRVISVNYSVTKGIGPEIAKLFDFGLVANDSKGEEFVPPPAFLFLPYYIDQEASWKSNWSGFKRLEQVRGYRRIIADYHTGIRPNEYYSVKSQLERQQIELKRLIAEQKTLAATRETVDAGLPFQSFDLSPEAFVAEVERLLSESAELAAVERAYSDEVQELRSQQNVVSLQAKAVRQELAELKLDFRFASSPDHLLGIECPTCGSVHENSFLDRFGIARDADRCEDLLRRLDEDLESLVRRIRAKETEFVAASSKREVIEEALGSTRGTITLREVIASEGRKQVQQVFRDQSIRYEKQMRELDANVSDLSRRARALNDKKRREEIVRLYLAKMNQYLHALNVTSLPAKSYWDVGARINETGSDLPRALLAYYYSILHTIRVYGSSVFCPIVIDSPNQQGQDAVNLPAMLRFIFDERPEDSQLIVACEDLRGTEPDGSILSFTDKNQVLQTTEYEAISSEVGSLLANSFRMEQG